MLTKGDDFPIHQKATPLAEVGSSRNFYDRYFFNGYSSEDKIFFGAVLCVYPNLNIMDAAFTIAHKGIQLEVTDRFKTRLIDEGYNPSYGARPLRRAVMRLLEDSLAEEVLSEKVKTGDTAVVDVGEDGKVKVLLGSPYMNVE